MILLSTSDPWVRLALEVAVRPDEEVVHQARRVAEALRYGFPRLYLCVSPSRKRGWRPHGVPVHVLERSVLRGWERDRLRWEVPPRRVETTRAHLKELVRRTALPRTWVDTVLAELARASGAPLPLAFRAFARRAMEYPRGYTDLGALAGASGLSRGALKNRFRRRGLDSPYTYLRWMRVLAVAEMLANGSTTVDHAADRLGFTSGANMCRMVRSLTGVTPATLRDGEARRRVTLEFVGCCLTPDRLDSWNRLGSLFEGRQVA